MLFKKIRKIKNLKILHINQNDYLNVCTKLFVDCSNHMNFKIFKKTISKKYFKMQMKIESNRILYLSLLASRFNITFFNYFVNKYNIDMSKHILECILSACRFNNIIMVYYLLNFYDVYLTQQIIKLVIPDCFNNYRKKKHFYLDLQDTIITNKLERQEECYSKTYILKLFLENSKTNIFCKNLDRSRRFSPQMTELIFLKRLNCYVKVFYHLKIKIKTKNSEYVISRFPTLILSNIINFINYSTISEPRVNYIINCMIDNIDNIVNLKKINENN